MKQPHNSPVFRETNAGQILKIVAGLIFAAALVAYHEKFLGLLLYIASYKDEILLILGLLLAAALFYGGYLYASGIAVTGDEIQGFYVINAYGIIVPFGFDRINISDIETISITPATLLEIIYKNSNDCKKTRLFKFQTRETRRRFIRTVLFMRPELGIERPYGY